MTRRNRTINAEGTVVEEGGDDLRSPNGNGSRSAPAGADTLTISNSLPLMRELETLRTEVENYRAEADLVNYRANQDAIIRALDLSDRDVLELASPWQMFAHELRAQIQGDDSWRGVQLVSIPEAADWHDARFGKWRAWRMLGDTIPAWGTTYRTTAMQVSTSYYAFITNLDIPLPNSEDRRRAERARKDYMESVDGLQSAQNNVGRNWMSFNEQQSSLPENRRLTFDQWYRQFDGRRISGLNQNVRLAEQEYTSWLVKAYRGYAFVADILSNYDNPAFQLSAESPDGQVNLYRTYNITPDLGGWVAAAKQRAEAGAPPKMTFTLTKDSTRSRTEDTVWGGNASWFGFFSFGARAGGGRRTVDTTHDHFRMSFEAADFQTFRIQPGPWFNGTAVKALKNGPWIEGGPVAKGNIKLWGPDGIFNLMPAQLVVAYRPKITVSVKRDEYHYVRSEFYARGGFSIGPFGFGASYSRKTEDVSFDESTNTITARDTSDVPQVMAVISNALPDYL